MNSEQWTVNSKHKEHKQTRKRRKTKNKRQKKTLKTMLELTQSVVILFMQLPYENGGRGKHYIVLKLSDEERLQENLYNIITSIK